MFLLMSVWAFPCECVSSNECVLVSTVKQPPTIIKQSVKDYIVDPRDNIIIECEAKGNPIPT